AREAFERGHLLRQRPVVLRCGHAADDQLFALFRQPVQADQRPHDRNQERQRNETESYENQPIKRAGAGQRHGGSLARNPVGRRVIWGSLQVVQAAQYAAGSPAAILRSQARLVLTMVSRLSSFGSHPSTLRIRSATATSSGGSPARRASS